MSQDFLSRETTSPDSPRSRLADDQDPFFVFDFQPVDGPDDRPAAEGPPGGQAEPADDPGRRWSTYWDVERLCRGPAPVPDWVVTGRGAIDTDLGVLKTGKEADVFLVERALAAADHADVPTTGDGATTPGAATVMAAKRYRGEEHRTFHRSSTYTEGRRTRNSRDARALAKKTAHGRAVAAGQWAWAEWVALKRFWSAGVPVPYPVQIDGTEILMELVTVDGAGAPRLAQTRPDRGLLASYFDQLRDAMRALAADGVAHGDLSPYNILAAGDRVVIIDLPQIVDVVANPAGMEFLRRDCRNVCSWFRARGLDVDEEGLFGDLVASAL
jgi:RIO kinase 1